MSCISHAGGSRHAGTGECVMFQQGHVIGAERLAKSHILGYERKEGQTERPVAHGGPIFSLAKLLTT